MITLPTITLVVPPKPMTLGQCDLLDIVEIEAGERCLVVEHFRNVGNVAVLRSGGWRYHHFDSTIVLLVGRLQLGGGT